MGIQELLQYVTITGLVGTIIGGVRLYGQIKKTIILDTQYKSKVESNTQEIEKLHLRLSNFKREVDRDYKDIMRRVDTDKDGIIKKFEEMDNKFEARFNKLTELIIDLFKKN